MSNCIYCGQSSQAGGTCFKSPSKTHVHHVKGKCSYCGQSSPAGGNCFKSPSKSHVHGVFQ